MSKKTHSHENILKTSSNQTCSIMLGIGALTDAALKPSLTFQYRTQSDILKTERKSFNNKTIHKLN